MILGELVTLVKPRITVLSVATAATGLLLAPGEPSRAVALYTLLGTLLVVGSANTLNMYLEQDVDARMERTRLRPLPAQRLAPAIALWFGIVQALAAIPLLTFGANGLTGLLGAAALLTYTMVYTPLKRRTTWSLLIGAVPGAMPPLLGWTAATGRIDLAAAALFAVMFLWQVPHFLAIAMFRRSDYAAAGLKVLPVERGEVHAQHVILRYLIAQVLVTLLLCPLGLGDTRYLVGALLLGSVMLAWSLVGLLRPTTSHAWARGLFAVSIIYLPALFSLLLVF
jgi:protoheme IX farnesyltransferase